MRSESHSDSILFELQILRARGRLEQVVKAARAGPSCSGGYPVRHALCFNTNIEASCAANAGSGILGFARAGTSSVFYLLNTCSRRPIFCTLYSNSRWSIAHTRTRRTQKSVRRSACPRNRPLHNLMTVTSTSRLALAWPSIFLGTRTVQYVLPSGRK